MDESFSELKPRKTRKAKTELESRTFKDGAIYLFKRADYKKPTWFCRVKVPNAKGYVSCSTKTTDEHVAFAFANDLFHKILARVHSGQDLHSKKVSSALDEYVAQLKRIVPMKTSILLKIQFCERMKAFFKTQRLKDIDTKLLYEFLDWLRDNSRRQALSANSIHRYNSDVKQFLNWCVERSYLENAPRFVKAKPSSNRRPHFDNKDWNKLVRHLREFVKDDHPRTVRDRTLLVNYVLILANTGIRVGEARTLKWRDLREIKSNDGSNEQPNIALYVKGKTGAREVVVRTPDVRTYFKRILELRTVELKKEIEKETDPIKARNMKVRPSPDDYVFCNRDGTPIGSFKKSFAALLKSAGVETDSHGEKRTIYSLRHTYATFRLQEGVHQFVLAKNMGTSVAMLEKHYGHTSNVASAAELTKGGRFKGGGKATAVDLLME